MAEHPCRFVIDAFFCNTCSIACFDLRNEHFHHKVDHYVVCRICDTFDQHSHAVEEQHEKCRYSLLRPTKYIKSSLVREIVFWSVLFNEGGYGDATTTPENCSVLTRDPDGCGPLTTKEWIRREEEYEERLKNLRLRMTKNSTQIE